MDSGTIIAVVTGGLALVGTTMTAFFAFRSGMPAAADEMAMGFKSLNSELRLELERQNSKHTREISDLKERHSIEMGELKVQIEKLRSDLTVERTSNEYLRSEVNRSDARAEYFRLGAFALYNQILDSNDRGYTKMTLDPVFDPRVNKYPPIKPFRPRNIDDEGPDEPAA